MAQKKGCESFINFTICRFKKRNPVKVKLGKGKLQLQTNFFQIWYIFYKHKLAKGLLFFDFLSNKYKSDLPENLPSCCIVPIELWK